MDFTTIIPYVLFVLETAALIGALLFLTRAFKAKKKSPEKSWNLRIATLFIFLFLALKILGGAA